jgi:hypothetical protein
VVVAAALRAVVAALPGLVEVGPEELPAEMEQLTLVAVAAATAQDQVGPVAAV